MNNTERLRLVSRRDVDRKLELLIDFYKEIYDYVIFLGERAFEPSSLFFTQHHLESDKLGVVFKSMLLEGYNAPVIVIINEKGLRYLVDGHHRTLISAWLGRKINGYALFIPRYKPRIARSILEVDVFNPPDIDDKIQCWKHMVNIIRFLEKQHKTIAKIWFSKIPINKLRPTEQLLTGPRGMYPMIDCPILIYNLNKENYVIDGHHRVCFKFMNGEKDILSIVFTLDNQEIGIVKTARKIGYIGFSREFCNFINQY
ncbi:MAG: chromosome partitioning protein ParB [Desulfurococcaceae archaeon]